MRFGCEETCISKMQFPHSQDIWIPVINDKSVSASQAALLVVTWPETDCPGDGVRLRCVSSRRTISESTKGAACCDVVQVPRTAVCFHLVSDGEKIHSDT